MRFHLRQYAKDNQGDINQQLEQLEAQISALQSQDMTTILPDDQWQELQSTLAKYHNCLKDREQICRQCFRTKWHMLGDRNTIFFIMASDQGGFIFI